jgi:hypothetical protein
MSNYKTNLVSGYEYFRDCTYMRVDFATATGISMQAAVCGPDAKLFEQKKPWWKLWLRNS